MMRSTWLSMMVIASALCTGSAQAEAQQSVREKVEAKVREFFESPETFLEVRGGFFFLVRIDARTKAELEIGPHLTLFMSKVQELTLEISVVSPITVDVKLTTGGRQKIKVAINARQRFLDNTPNGLGANRAKDGESTNVMIGSSHPETANVIVGGRGAGAEQGTGLEGGNGGEVTFLEGNNRVLVFCHGGNGGFSAEKLGGNGGAATASSKLDGHAVARRGDTGKSGGPLLVTPTGGEETAKSFGRGQAESGGGNGNLGGDATQADPEAGKGGTGGKASATIENAGAPKEVGKEKKQLVARSVARGGKGGTGGRGLDGSITDPTTPGGDGGPGGDSGDSLIFRTGTGQLNAGGAPVPVSGGPGGQGGCGIPPGDGGPGGEGNFRFLNNQQVGTQADPGPQGSPGADCQ